MSKLYGWRKFLVVHMAMVLSTVAVGMGWIEGLQYASIITLCVSGYMAANVTAKTKTP